MATFSDTIARLLYPENAVCIACGALRVEDTARHLCSECADALIPLSPPFCPRCGASGWAMECPDCTARPQDALDQRISAYAYRDTAFLLIRALKYTNVECAAEALAPGIAAALPPDAYDALVPVPLHKRRKTQRGFNQAYALCEALSKHTNLPVLDALTRNKPTKTQTRLSREGRLTNVRGAFSINAEITGRSLLLVDDVLTTGATALACAETLKAAGAVSVTLATAARVSEQEDA